MIKLPYSDIFGELLARIHVGLGYCHHMNKKGVVVNETDTGLSEIYKGLRFEARYRKMGLNKHLIKGLTKSEQTKNNIFPRLSKLTIQAYYKAQESKRNPNYVADVIPSPLNILYSALTNPEEPQTSSYPFILCRSMLFYFLGLHPKISGPNFPSQEYAEFCEEDILNSVNSFNNYIKIQLRWPDPRSNLKSFQTRINLLVGNIMSIKGITLLWFNNEEEISRFCFIDKSSSYIDELREKYSNPKYRFRLSSQFSGLPESSEILNWIFGIPLPLRGADVLFHGGLKKAASTGLVINILGQPGTGKTSTALSFAAALAPFKTNTIYLSLEEDEGDLLSRLTTLIPVYLKELSIYHDLIDKGSDQNSNSTRKFSWFFPYKIKSNVSIEELSKILKLLERDLVNNSKSQNYPKTSPKLQIPAICPTLIVIDNINELFTDNKGNISIHSQLEMFIEQCRNIGAIVILIGSDDISRQTKIDYLVDIAIHLKINNLDKPDEKPVRTFQLIKTRHQVSRLGSHVFHLSNSKGIRISPQVPSQIDKREKVKVKLPSEIYFINTLNILHLDNHDYYYKYLPLACKSQILIHGYGSTGKAGLGLKILFTPILSKHSLDNVARFPIKIEPARRNKVLIVSFLYPEDYYLGLAYKINKQFVRIYESYAQCSSQIVVKAFFPGYLTPEDFVYKIIRLLDEANLEGEPFSGILLDGLHNIYLQFKNLQKSDMIWPLLYSLLSRFNLTVVTTFTNFSITETHLNRKFFMQNSSLQSPDDLVILQQGQRPFLHGLVKAADYYIILEEVIDDSLNFQRNYLLSVKSSIRQKPPTEYLQYDRNNLIFDRAIPPNEIFEKIRTYHD